MSDTATDTQSDREKWLAALLLIRPQDIDAARQMWVDHAPRAFRGMLDNDGFTYDPQKLVYVTGHGKDVGDRDAKRLSLLIALVIAHELQRQAQYVAEGTTPISEWQDQAASTIKDLFIVQGALGAGGFNRLTPEAQAAIIGSVESKFGLAFSLDRLLNFGNAIANKEPRADTPEAITYRAGLYADAPTPVREKIRRDAAKVVKDDRGRPAFLFEKNVLTPGENCADGNGTQGCIEVTAQGWQPIGTLPDIGDRTCTFRCRCSWAFSLTGPAVTDDL